MEHNLHEKTQTKIKNLFDMGDRFCDGQLEKYEDNPDVTFVVNGFQTLINDVSFKLRKSKTYSIEAYNAEIFAFDSTMSAWREHLVYKFPTDNDKGNDLYDVLFSILQGAETIAEEDHFMWEEEEDDMEEESESEEINEEPINHYDIDPDIELSRDEDDDNYIEKTF